MSAHFSIVVSLTYTVSSLLSFIILVGSSLIFTVKEGLSPDRPQK